MDNYQQFVALRCETCGGKLDVPKQHIVDGGDGSFTIVGNDTFTCNFCDTEYLPKQSLERFAPPSSIGGVTFSGITGATISLGSINITTTVDGDIIGSNLSKKKSEASDEMAVSSQVSPIAGGDLISESPKTTDGDLGKEKSEASAKMAAASQVSTIASNDFRSASTKPPEAKKKWWQFWK